MTLLDFDDYRFDTYSVIVEKATPYEQACKEDIRAFVECEMEDEIEAELEESPYMSKEEVIDWLMEHHEDEIAERYNECYKIEYEDSWR